MRELLEPCPRVLHLRVLNWRGRHWWLLVPMRIHASGYAAAQAILRSHAVEAVPRPGGPMPYEAAAHLSQVPPARGCVEVAVHVQSA